MGYGSNECNVQSPTSPPSSDCDCDWILPAGSERNTTLSHHDVALQVAFERQTLKPVFSLDSFQVMGLKGYRLWVMGQFDSTCRAPPRRRRHKLTPLVKS
jgi:hypothetical protein